jgi:hypothetical protein
MYSGAEDARSAHTEAHGEKYKQTLFLFSLDFLVLTELPNKIVSG